MIPSKAKSAYLLLADGTLFEGNGFGVSGTVAGEVVFNTGMTGYQEVLTDPSYYRQLVTFTYPELGNTGVNPYDQEAERPFVKGLIVRNLSTHYSSWRSTGSLESWLTQHNVIGISGIDTRALVRHLREFGSMNGIISSDNNLSPEELFNQLRTLPFMQGLNLVKDVSTKSPYKWQKTCLVNFDKRNQIRKDSFNKPYQVVVLDFGVKRTILERLVSYGCELQVLPADSDFSTVMSYKPEGIFLSNGPGDPSSVLDAIDLTRDLLEKTNLPIFGICLGHQILGLALGGKTFKLEYGHRGLNHPCGQKGRLEITSQNHGFALDANSLPFENIQITHMNLNDHTVAGIAMKDKPVFGIQYHPEASPGPHDADHHFYRFVELIEKFR